MSSARAEGAQIIRTGTPYFLPAKKLVRLGPAKAAVLAYAALLLEFETQDEANNSPL